MTVKQEKQGKETEREKREKRHSEYRPISRHMDTERPTESSLCSLHSLEAAMASESKSI